MSYSPRAKSAEQLAKAEAAKAERERAKAERMANRARLSQERREREAAEKAERERISAERKAAYKAGRKVKGYAGKEVLFGEMAPARAARAERSKAAQRKARVRRVVRKVAEAKAAKAPRISAREAARPVGHLSLHEARDYLAERGITRNVAALSRAGIEGRLETVRTGARQVWTTPAALGRYLVESKRGSREAMAANLARARERRGRRARDEAV